MLIPILYEDASLVAVNKPTSLPVHETVDKARPHLQGIVERQVGLPLVLFHRLDLETTGVVLFGKDPTVNRPITDAFRDRKMQKTYWAVVDGRWLSEWSNVESFIVKAAGGKWCNALRGSVSEAASTDFQVLASNGNKTLLEVKPKTGRTHQIRLHCQSKHHPILGDSLYGRKDPFGVTMALHALELSFCHPLSGEELRLRAPLPDFWPRHWLKGLPNLKVPV